MIDPIEFTLDEKEGTYLVVSMTADNEELEPMIEMEVGSKEEGDFGSTGMILKSDQAIELSEWLRKYANWRKRYEQSSAVRLRRDDSGHKVGKGMPK